MAHDVDTLLVRCADPRYAQEGDFAEGLQELLAEAHAERHYLLTALGGSLEFTRGQTTLGWLWRLEQARAFGVKRLLLVDHLDCRAFEAAFGPLTEAEEASRHRDTLKEARQFLQTHAPALEALGFLQRGEDVERVF